MAMNQRRTRRHLGAALIWVTVAFTAMLAFASLAVDYGRVQLVKTELLRAADAAAREAATDISNGISTAQTATIQTTAANACDGSAIIITNTDIEFNNNDTTNDTFTVL